ncbi:MAG: Gfo/Idh/MocA family oxidoreductase [Firmicutes bacterium]|mgnify:FL=1|nr:Gfo/Idh/MocA family oxidoreductase [Bacillota bacterium]
MDTKNLAVIGFGGRGHIYGEFSRKYPEKFQLKAVAETDEYRRRDAKENFGAEVYEDYKELLDQGYRLDLVAIATQDAQHKEHALYALNRGYDLLLEKPVAITEKDCLEIYECAKKNNRRVYVCHVLRYTPFYSKIKEIIDEGTLGEIVNVHASENVGYYHQAHSYVRGPWRNSGESSPMILAKCCHDMDILRYLIGEKCVSVNSYGSLSYFKEENAPENAEAFCTDCPRKEDCAYNAQKLYTKYVWPAGYFTKGALTEENILRDLKYSPYDRCVFKCDNDVVDHQSTLLLFEKGKTAVHTMTAFSREIYRDIKIYGTKAELAGVMEKNLIEIRPFGGEPFKAEVNASAASVGGHCGGDYYMMCQIWNDLNGIKGKGITYLDVSIESHLMSFGAEKSRLHGGESCKIEFVE